MCLPGGKGTQFMRGFHVIKESEHLAELVHSIGWDAFCAVLRIESFQALMDNVPYLHLAECSL